MIQRIHMPSVIRCGLAVLIVIAAFGVFFSACGGNDQKHFTIGIAAEVVLHEPVIDGFKKGMAAFHYVEGENITYIYDGATGPDAGAMDDEIKKLLAQKVDMLFATSNLAALRSKLAVNGTDIPVVFGAVSNPVGEGIVDSLSHPGGNVTGIQVGLEVPKALEWLTRIVPDVRKVFLPYNPNDPVSVMFIDMIDATVPRLGIELVHGEVQSVEEAVTAIRKLPPDVQAIFMIPSPTLDPDSNKISQAAIDCRLPLVTGHPVDETVLLSLVSDFAKTGERAARLANQILQGMKPADLPVETNEVSLIINIKTASSIGLEIPDRFLHQATSVIR